MITISGIDNDVESGFLGNKLFMLANSYNVSQENSEDLVLPPFEFQDLFKTKFFTILPKEEIKVLDTYSEPSFTYSKVPQLKNTSLSGYFQSSKYFDRKEIMKLFQCNNKLTQSILNSRIDSLGISYGDLFAYNKVCSIHKREGDYNNLSQFHTNLSMSYYEEAMEHFLKVDYFLVFSNDIKKCKTLFKGNKFIFSETPQDKPQGNSSASFDLYLQSMCNYHIIANSTFSWWSAFLNNSPSKVIISPNGKSGKYPWFGPLNTLDSRDIVPENWIKL